MNSKSKFSILLVFILLFFQTTYCNAASGNASNSSDIFTETPVSQTSDSASDEVIFKDPALENAIRSFINKFSGPILKSDVENIMLPIVKTNFLIF